jgi:hypothetical protein
MGLKGCGEAGDIIATGTLTGSERATSGFLSDRRGRDRVEESACFESDQRRMSPKLDARAADRRAFTVIESWALADGDWIFATVWHRTGG